MKYLILFSAMLFSVAESFAENIALVENGRAKASIVLASDASAPEKFAAETFVNYVEKITGAKLVIGTAPLPEMLPVRIGTRSATNMVKNASVDKNAGKIVEDGYIVSADKTGVTVTGNKKRSVIYAVSHLLGKYGGVIWFYPGRKVGDPEAEYCPKSPDFRIPEGTFVKNPDFTLRRYFTSGVTENEWLVLNGQQVVAHGEYGWTLPHFWKCDPIFTRGGHDMTGLLLGKDNYDKLFKEHPEYFGLCNGKRVDSGNMPWKVGQIVCQPCTSNPEVLKRMANNAIESMKLFKGKGDSFRDFSNDDHTRWCQCENCRKLDLPLDTTGNNREGNRWWHFLNRMAAEMRKDDPNVQIQTLVYQTYRYPPAGITPDPRVRVAICPHHRCYIHSLTDPRCPMNVPFRKMFEEWHKAAMTATSFEYFNQMCGLNTYLPMEKSWIEDLRFYHKHNVKGYLFTGSTMFDIPEWKANMKKYRDNPWLMKYPYDGGNWVARWQHCWMNAYFSWNIDDDYDKVYEYVNSKYYGAAWPFMKKYRAELIAALYESGIHVGYEFPDQTIGRCFERPGFPASIYKLLDQASAAVSGDVIRTRRIERDRAYFESDWVRAYKDYCRNRQSEYNAGHRTGQIVIDGKLDENDWKNGLGYITGFKLFASDGKKDAVLQTYGRILFDENNIYFGVEALKAPGASLKASKNPFSGEHLEFFISPPALNSKYYQLALNANGKVYQALASSASNCDKTFTTSIEYKITDSPEKWTLEIRIPTDKLGGTVKTGDMWKINIGRGADLTGGQQEISSVANGVFHDALDLYRTVVMGKEGPIFRNGDFEEYGAWKRPANSKHPWNFFGGKASYWYYNETTDADAEIRKDNPPSGKTYLRLIPKKSTAMLGQFVHTNQKAFPKGLKNADVSLKVRGKGEVIIYLSGKSSSGEKKNRVTFNVDSPDKWTTVSGTIEVHEQPNALWIRLNSSRSIDIDDFRFAPAAIPDSGMPSMEAEEKRNN
ncbi:MAG: hypothetical protein BWY31_02272 [Lentisphaerae bacterium ADurb.Bin242]|nr:MAG: hypothetical protein BWY31_02272 [Lentisphaerae bacterium ADurb.Bin242]